MMTEWADWLLLRSKPTECSPPPSYSGPLPIVNWPSLSTCDFDGTNYDSGLIEAAGKDSDCGGSTPANACGGVRCCVDGGPDSFGNACPFGTDSNYCGPRYRCPAGSEGHAVLKGSMQRCLSAVDVCMWCEAGKFKPQPGTQNEEAAACADCPPGRYANLQGSTSCEPCPAGTYNELSRGASVEICISCPPGTYNGEAGSDSAEDCTPCPEGQKRAFDEDVCSSCAGATIASNAGMAFCAPCDPGSVPNEGKTACVPCEPGLAAAFGADACSPCDAGWIAADSGAA